MPDIFTSSSPLPVTSPPKRKKTLAHQIFSAYSFMPENVRFETQEPGESILLLLRKHWVTNLHWILIGSFLIAFPPFAFPAVAFLGLIPSQLPSSWVSFSFLGWYLITFSYILTNFLLWYFTVSIVTSERIIDVDFINILSKKFAETRIARLEDVSMRTGGFIRSFFDYGDVTVQTAAKEAVFHFDSVPRPHEVVRLINQLMGKEEEEAEGRIV